MKFSYNWICEFTGALETPARELEQLITLKTAECEGIEPAGELLRDAVVARVEAAEPIAGTHLTKAVVDTGRHGRRTVVCGAPNCRAGMLTAWVPLGKKTIQGVESDGMLASGAELGINKDGTGILELAGEVGGPVPGCPPDFAIDIDNKSITHRPDLWGHFGMAREVAAILGKPLRDPVRLDLVPSGPCPVKIEIGDFKLCPRYSALVFENVTVTESPLWLQCRLTQIGLNPINNIVDLTNYIMAELAQPMHAFDADLLRGDTIYVRNARAGEAFTALNDLSYTLEPSNLAIADAGGAVALAGVIGGLDSAITARTTRIVFESANFHAASIRRTSSALKLRTDASMRFEKSQDPVNTVRALARAVELMAIVCPGARLVGGLGDSRREPSPAPVIRLPLDWLARKLGRQVPAAEVRQILERLQFGVAEPEPGVFSVTVPSWRATKDVAVKDDLVEEVGRMIGYDSIPPAAPLLPSVPPGRNETRLYHRAVRGMMTAQGFTEVYNYSFISEAQARELGFDPAAHIRILNPIASDQELMRTSLLPGVLKNLRENGKHFDRFRLFEIGLEIHPRAEGLPEEVPHLAAAIHEKGDGTASLFELKRAAECLMPGAEVRPGPAAAYEHPARAAEVWWRGERVGRLFELHPAMLETGRGAVLDLDLCAVERLRPEREKYRPVRRFPASEFDLSVIAGARELAGDLQTKLVSFAGELLESIEYLRQYSGPPLAEGSKSVSYRLTVGSPERTLSLDDVGRIRQRIIDGMRGLGYELRV